MPEERKPCFNSLNFLRVSKRTFDLAGLKDLDDNEIVLKDSSGKVTMLHFWSTWCGGCMAELDELLEFVDANKDILNFIPISHDRSLEDLTSFLQKKSLTAKHEWCLDTTAELYWQRFSGVFIPASCFLDKEGKLALFNQDGVYIPLLIGIQPWKDSFYTNLVRDIYRGNGIWMK